MHENVPHHNPSPIDQVSCTPVHDFFVGKKYRHCPGDFTESRKGTDIVLVITGAFAKHISFDGRNCVYQSYLVFNLNNFYFSV